MKPSNRHIQALEEIASFNGDIDFREACIYLIGVAKSALDPNRKETLLEHLGITRPVIKKRR